MYFQSKKADDMQGVNLKIWQLNCNQMHFNLFCQQNTKHTRVVQDEEIKKVYKIKYSACQALDDIYIFFVKYEEEQIQDFGGNLQKKILTLFSLWTQKWNFLNALIRFLFFCCKKHKSFFALVVAEVWFLS